MTQKNNNKKYDLEERTAKFGEDIILFCKIVPRGPITDPLITSRELGMKQMMQRVKKIFPKGCLWHRHKIGIVKKRIS